MQPHPYFDLLLHDDAGLEDLLGVGLRERVTLHEWPLSCVQRLRLADGRSFIYKAQAGPTVEPEFYAQARSPLLPWVRTLYRDARYACLLVEYLPYTLLSAAELNLPDALRLGRLLLEDIGGVQGPPGGLPVYLNISSWGRFQAFLSGMLEDLQSLIASRAYTECTPAVLRAVARCAASPQVRAAVESGSGLVHHDLSDDNVFLIPSGQFKVVDWQRPIYGPPEIDLVLLLSSLGFDPRPHVAPGVATLTNLLRIHWLVECTRCWFPPGAQTYDRAIAQMAGRLG